MFDDVPVRLWLLLLLAALAWTPARYVFRHLANSPFKRDITKPANDLTWRSSATLQRNAAILLGLATLGIFIFTPAATEWARSPTFIPILLIGLGGFVLWSVVKGFLTGRVEPMVRGANWEFRRDEQPKRFWASMGWNVLVGGFLFVIGGQLLFDAPKQALRDRCYLRKDDSLSKGAIEACNQLLADDPGDDRSHHFASRGSIYYRLGDYRHAVADYTAAIRLDPREASTQYNLGLVHERLGDREGAVANYNAAIAIDPQDVEALQNRGLIQLDTGRFDRAISDFTRAHDLAPKNAMILADRGISYAWMGDGIHAEQDLAAVRKRDPLNVVALHGEALLALKHGDLIGGIRVLSDTIAHNPKDAWALTKRAEAYRYLGDREKMNADIIAARR